MKEREERWRGRKKAESREPAPAQGGGREGGAGAPPAHPAASRPLLSLPSSLRHAPRPGLPAPLPPPPRSLLPGAGWNFFPWTGASSGAGAGRGEPVVVEARPDWAGRWGGAGAGAPWVGGWSGGVPGGGAGPAEPGGGPGQRESGRRQGGWRGRREEGERPSGGEGGERMESWRRRRQQRGPARPGPGGLPAETLPPTRERWSRESTEREWRGTRGPDPGSLDFWVPGGGGGGGWGPRVPNPWRWGFGGLDSGVLEEERARSTSWIPLGGERWGWGSWRGSGPEETREGCPPAPSGELEGEAGSGGASGRGRVNVWLEGRGRGREGAAGL